MHLLVVLAIALMLDKKLFDQGQVFGNRRHREELLDQRQQE